MNTEYMVSGKDFDGNDIKEAVQLETQGSLTGIVWLPFQEKYAHLYKYYRFRPSDVAFPKPIDIGNLL